MFLEQLYVTILDLLYIDKPANTGFICSCRYQNCHKMSKAVWLSCSQSIQSHYITEWTLIVHQILSQTANYSKNISIGNINFILSIVTKMNETSIILQLQGMAGIWQNNPKVCINRPKSVNEIYKNFCHHSIYILSLSNIIFLVKQNTLNANI